MSGASTDAASVQTMLAATRDLLPDESAALFAARLESMCASVAVATALSRRVRRALSGRVSRAAFIDVLENVRTALAPLIGEHCVEIEAGNTAAVFVHGQLDVIGLALIELGLRAFRVGGSGLLRIAARRRKVSAPSALVVEIIGEQPVGNEIGAIVDPTSGLVPMRHRGPDEDRAFDAAAFLLASSGGAIEADEWTLDSSRTVVVLREE
jgi:hypothetical protein